MKQIVIPVVLLLSLCSGLPRAGAESSDALYKKGVELEKQFKTSEALAAFLEAEKTDPDNVELLIEIAKQYGDLLGDQKTKVDSKAMGEKALEYAKRSYALAPDQWDTNLTMAVCYGKLTAFMGNKQKVAQSKMIKAFADKAVALNPENDYAHHMLGRWHQELASMGGFTRGIANTFLGGLPDASFEQALAELDKARKLRPDRLIHQVEYGRTLIMMGRKEEGKKELAKGLAMPNTERGDPVTKARGQKTLDDAG